MQSRGFEASRSNLNKRHVGKTEHGERIQREVGKFKIVKSQECIFLINHPTNGSWPERKRGRLCDSGLVRVTIAKHMFPEY